MFVKKLLPEEGIRDPIDGRKITSLGVIERVYHKVRSPEQIVRLVGKRSVYTRGEIEEMARKPTKVILFRHHFHFENPSHLITCYRTGYSLVHRSRSSKFRIPSI